MTRKMLTCLCLCLLWLFCSIYRELRRENTWARIHLVPLLLAEGDRDAYRREQAAQAREREIMKDVRGWEVSAILDWLDWRTVSGVASRAARSNVDGCRFVFG
jgi:hypothetical protein